MTVIIPIMDHLASILSLLFISIEHLSGWAGIRIAVAAFAAALLYNALRRLLDRALHWGKGVEATRLATIRAVLVVVLRVGIIVAVLLLILPEFGFTIGPLLASRGIFGLAISFGAQSLVKDVVSGFFILAEDICRVGEEVKVGDARGRVESLRVRTLTIRDADGALVFVPYGEIKNLVNYSRAGSSTEEA